MLKKFLIGGALVFSLSLIAITALIFTQPDDYQLERHAIIDAEPAVVFELIDDFRQWENWSPWADADPSMKNTYSGSPRGKGAVYEWSGEGEAGAGRMEIIESRPAEFVEIQLTFVEPFESQAITYFHLDAIDDNSTEVTWGMRGQIWRISSERATSAAFTSSTPQHKTESSASHPCQRGAPWLPPVGSALVQARPT